VKDAIVVSEGAVGLSDEWDERLPFDARDWKLLRQEWFWHCVKQVDGFRRCVKYNRL